MSFIENNPWAVVLGTVGVVVAVVLFIVETGIADAFTSIFDWSADNADSYGFSSTAAIIRIVPLVLFGVGIPLGVIVAVLKLFR
ncbi:MAG: hypothetical protein IJT54_09115 [Candidatus Methanomethylophilaceae archaeon]|nr:hypothetical protein [Candidatus Methanomethylophilaceae archaeon]